MSEVTITSNGLAQNTKVLLDGAEIPNVYKIVIDPIEVGQVVDAAIYIRKVNLDIKAQEFYCKLR